MFFPPLFVPILLLSSTYAPLAAASLVDNSSLVGPGSLADPTSLVDHGGGKVLFGPNWGAGSQLSYAHIVRLETIFYAGVAPAVNGRVRRFAVWPSIISELDLVMVRAYAAQSEEPYFRKEYVSFFCSS
jgi:hypothetical protein